MVATLGKIGFVMALGLVLCMALVSRTFGQSVQRADAGQASQAAPATMKTEVPPGDQPVMQLSSVHLDSYQQFNRLERRCWFRGDRRICSGGEGHGEHDGGEHDGGEHDGGEHDGGEHDGGEHDGGGHEGGDGD